MTRRLPYLVGLLALVAALAAPAAFAQTTYSGRATALNASILGIAATAGDTGPLPSTGGSQTASLASLNVLGLLSADVLKGAASASGSQSTSQASVADLSLGLIGLD